MKCAYWQFVTSESWAFNPNRRLWAEAVGRRRLLPGNASFYARNARLYLIDFIGADSQNRTVDPIITNDVLYQLS
jgi:hypothetical protein